MKYTVEYIDEAKDDLKELDGSQRQLVRKMLDKVAQNPVAKNDGGYGNPLGNKQGNNLTGCFKIKMLKLGIRVVYQLVKVGNVMKIIVIGARADNEVYVEAAKRIKNE